MWGRIGLARLWDLQTGQELNVFPQSAFSLSLYEESYLARYIPSKNQFVSVPLSPIDDIVPVYVWDFDNPYSPEFEFGSHHDIVNSIDVSSNGKYLLTGSDDKQVKLWDIETGRDVYGFVKHQDRVMSVEFSPNDKMVLSGSFDGMIYLWDVSQYTPVRLWEFH